MCGILGFVGANTTANRELVRQLMYQLSLRGTHATGISVLVKDQIRTVSMPVDAKTFFDRVTLDSPMNVGKTLKMIGHTRYSTSDLRWNQPLDNGSEAIVLNGVISQEPPHEWPTQFRPYLTGNDAEIALNAAHQNRRAQYGGSWAICELNATGWLLAYRNRFRPLWTGKGPDYHVACSTADALLRCGVETIHQMSHGEVLDLCTGKVCEVFAQHGPDLQGNLNSLFPDLQCHV